MTQEIREWPHQKDDVMITEARGILEKLREAVRVGIDVGGLDSLMFNTLKQCYLMGVEDGLKL